MAFDGSQVRSLHLQTTGEIDLVGLDDSGVGAFPRPDHAGQHGGGDLQAGGVLARRDLRVSSTDSREPNQ